MKFIITESQLSRLVDENDLNLNIFDSMPEDILNALENYRFMYNNFDWDQKADEFKGDRAKLLRWIHNHEQEEFIKNKAKIIKAVRDDLIREKRNAIAGKKLLDFETKLVDLLGHHITANPGDETINIPEFERFVEANPRYKKADDQWMQLQDEHSKYLFSDRKGLHIRSYAEMKKLYNYLIGK